jgi:hypothetical protein
MDFLFAFFDIFGFFGLSEDSLTSRHRSRGSSVGNGPIGMGNGPIGMGNGPIG